MRFVTFFLLYFCLSGPSLQAQMAPLKTGKAYLVEINYGQAWSAGDLSKRFGSKNTIGTGITLQNKANIQIGLSLNYYFGNQVKEDVLANLRNEQGVILGVDGFASLVFLRDRGVNINFHLGKVFKLEPDSKSGIRFNFGLGMLQHWVRVQDESRSLPQIVADYRTGYDHKSRGVAINQFIGYQYLSNDSRINFFGGLEFTQAFTKNIRASNFATQSSESEGRKDRLVAVKAGIILPFHKVDKPDEIFY